MPNASNMRSRIYYAIAAIGFRATLVLSLVIAATAILLTHKRRTWYVLLPAVADHKPANSICC